MPPTAFRHGAHVTRLAVAIGLLIAGASAFANHGDAPFGTCMSISLIPYGAQEVAPFGGYECGDGVSRISWDGTTPGGNAHVFGAADASEATVRSRASIGGGFGIYSASMWVRSWDTLTFAADGDVTLQWRFDGDITISPHPLIGQNNLVGMWFGFGPTFGWNYLNYNDPDPYHLGHYDVQGSTTLHVTAGTPYVIYTGLQTNASGPDVDVDFSHTGRIVIDMPAQQRFTSASGVFLTAPVPEPATSLMLMAGLALIGGLRRRRSPLQSLVPA